MTKAEYRLHLRSSEIAAHGHPMRRDATRGELLHQFIAPGSRRPKQNDNIRIVHGTKTARTVRNLLMRLHTTDLLRDHCRLQHLCIVSTVLLQRFRSAVSQKDPCLVSIRFRCPRIIRPRIEGRSSIILHAAHVTFHDTVKQIVDAVQYLRAAAEIPIQTDLPTRCILRGISVILFHKQLRSCQTEAVDALLHIPDHETIVSSATS